MGKILKVDSKEKIPALEKLLISANIKIVGFFSPTCGPCRRFKKDIWDPSLKKKAQHHRIEIRNDMMPFTSLANENIEYLPSLIVVDEKGNVQNTLTPEGKETPVIPTPTNLKDMVRIANVPVKPSPNVNSPLANTRKANNRINSQKLNDLSATIANNISIKPAASISTNTPAIAAEPKENVELNKTFQPVKGGTRRKTKVGPKRRTRR